MRRHDHTLQQIGDAHRVSRERVRQVLETLPPIPLPTAAEKHRLEGEARRDEILSTFRSIGRVPEVAARLAVHESVVREVVDEDPEHALYEQRSTVPRLYSRSELLDALREVAAVKGTDKPTTPQYDAYAEGRVLADGRPFPSKQTVLHRFDGWVEARRSAGLTPGERAGPPRQWSEHDCARAVARLWNERGEAPRTTWYAEWAKGRSDVPSFPTVRNRLSRRWTDVLQRAKDFLHDDGLGEPGLGNVGEGQQDGLAMPERASQERRRRKDLWRQLQPTAAGRAIAPTGTVRELRIYTTGRGIFADRAKTRQTTGDPRGATVSVRHTGRHYPDDLTAHDITYHYPETKNASTDEMEIEATKAAGELGLPIFVVLDGERDRWREIRPAWVTGWDDTEGIFRMQFGSIEVPLPSSSLIGEREEIAPLEEFRPKDASDYRAWIAGREIVKTRRHERLIADYGKWAQVRGFRASTAEHPKDLVLRRDGQEWLVEGKVVRRGNATHAVREALSQLLMYQRFLEHESPPDLVALFSEDVGAAYVEFLAEQGVEGVWSDDGRWVGSPRCVSDGLAEAERA